MKDGGRVRPVILAGGAGTRLWPMSTAARPKHLLPLIGIRACSSRRWRGSRSGAVRPADRRRQPGAGGRAGRIARADRGAVLILEPMKRDSAPAIALAALAADADDCC